ncbi:MAG: serine hydrolase [Pseudomonadota bacterium]
MIFLRCLPAIAAAVGISPLIGAPSTALADDHDTAANGWSYSALPQQPSGTPWPQQSWPRAPLPPDADADSVARIISALMADYQHERLGTTHAVVVVQGGRIIAEEYREGYACDGITHTMSIAKMMGAVVAGAMQQDGLIDVDAPADIPIWRESDPRSAITPAQFLQMTSGLRWDEFLDFLGLAAGQGYKDNAAYVFKKPLDYDPGTHFQYSDGAPGIIGYLLGQRLGVDPGQARADAVTDYIQERLLGPVGMDTTEPEFDLQGTWYGSSGIRWSPCDLARFSLLLLRDGVWDGERLLPEGWVDRMRTPTLPSMAETSDLRMHYQSGYGMTSFVYDLDFGADDLTIDAFGHTGFAGHVLKITPSKDLIVMVLGSDAVDPERFAVRLELTHALTEAFAEVSGNEANQP